MNAPSHETKLHDPVPSGEPAVIGTVSPNYAFYGKDQVIDAPSSLAALVVEYLRGLDARTLALLLTLVGLAAVAVTLAWPSAVASGYRVLGAVGVALLLAIVGGVVFVTAKETPDAPRIPTKDDSSDD